MMRSTVVTLLLVSACQPGDDTDPPADNTDGVVDTDHVELEDRITVTTPLIGATECFDPAGDWGAQIADPSCQVLVPVTGDIEDFESGDGVSGAIIELFYDDRLGETPDATLTSDQDGLVSGGSATSCSPFTARISTDPSREETKLTIQQHWTEGFGDPMDTFFNSVGVSTYLLIPAILGFPPDATKGLVAGTAYDCGGEGVPLEGAQVIIKDAEGRYPASAVVHYFQKELPSTLQTTTSDDGLWMALNVPPGRVTIELWGIVGDDLAPQLVGSAEADVVADGITIADLYLGDNDGVQLDAECLLPCAP